MEPIAALLQGNTYPGRGIVAGCSPSGKAIFAYFIMGRSENSRNRLFREAEEKLCIDLFDPAKVKDPSLICYTPVRVCPAGTIVSNGDQTDTLYDALCSGKSFRAALDTRTFEPDEPNYTPRISALLTPDACQMSIIKRAPIDGACLRLYWSYPMQPGTGHFISTYAHDGNPLPSFQGEPRPVSLPDSPQELLEQLWQALDHDNRVSLYVRYLDPASGSFESGLKNRHTGD